MARAATTRLSSFSCPVSEGPVARIQTEISDASRLVETASRSLWDAIDRADDLNASRAIAVASRSGLVGTFDARRHNARCDSSCLDRPV